MRGDTYWFAKQVNGRRSFISLETGDYVAALQHAREIVETSPLITAKSSTVQRRPASLRARQNHGAKANRLRIEHFVISNLGPVHFPEAIALEHPFAAAALERHDLPVNVPVAARIEVTQNTR